MKKILLLILTIASFASYGQQSDAANTAQFDIIRSETVQGANTKDRIATAYDVLNSSKVNRSETVIASGTNDYTITPTYTPDYSKNPSFVIKFVNGNTGPVTVNGIAVKKSVSSALASGDIGANSIHTLVYDGTNFQIQIASSGGGLSTTLSPGHIYVGNGSSVATDVAVSGDATLSSAGSVAVIKINGVSMAGLPTGILKNTTTTGVPSIAVAGTDYTTPSSTETVTNKNLTSGTNTFPTLNQNTTGTAANLSGTPALPSGTTATTQSTGDNTTKISTDAFVVSEIISRAPKVFAVAASDEYTAVTAGTGKITFRTPYAMTVTSVRASLVTAQVSGNVVTVDINLNGTSILSTKLTFDNTEKTTVTAVTPPVIGTSALADDSEISIDIDQVGNGTATGLKITLIGQ